MTVINAEWVIRPESPAIAPCGSCSEKPLAGVGVLGIGGEFVVICPYCMARALAGSWDAGIHIEVRSNPTEEELE